MPKFKKIIDIIFIDGLVIQISLFLFGLIFLLMSCGIVIFALPDLIQTDIAASVGKNFFIGFACLLIVGLFTLGIMWMLAGIFPPHSKWAKYGLRMPPDGVEIALFVIVPVLILIATIIAYFLRLFGVSGYPIKQYKDLYSAK